MERFGYQHKELREAVSILTSFTMKPAERVSGAMSAIATGFLHHQPPGDAAESYRRVRRLMEGDGSFDDRASRMAVDDMTRFKNAVLDLEGRVARAYHEATSR